MIIDYKSEIASLLSDAFAKSSFALTVPAAELAPLVGTPREKGRGDYSFPLFSFAKTARRAPQEIASEIARTMTSVIEAHRAIAGVEAAGGYLNFTVNKAYLAEKIIPGILKGELLARRPSRNERVMIEYSQPNTHKAFHVGHTRCASLGDSLIRILEWTGCDVIAANYLGDEGTHVARCLWYLKNCWKGPVPEHNRGEFLGELYTKATLELDLSTMTNAPFPGVSAAKVSAIAPHPSEPKWKVVSLETRGGTRTVVCGGAGYKIGDTVYFAGPGAKLGGRTIGTIEKDGVVSEGMMPSERELGLSDDNNKIVLAPAGTAIGTEVAEVYRIPGAVAEGRGVLEVYREREAEVSEMLQKLESGDPEAKALWDETKDWSLQEYYEIYDWLRCRFDHYFFESEFGEEGKALAREFKEKGVFVSSRGTIGANLEPYNLGFCILIKSDGTATYAARDLALARRKFDQYHIDRSVYVVDSAQTFHFQQVFKCLQLMGYSQAEKCYHHGYAQVILPDGKMSSRKGNIILFSALKDRLREKIMTEFLEKYRGEWPDEEIETAVNRISQATIRYGMVGQDNNSLIVFDLDEWTSRSGNTGPYMLYAYARIRSILRTLGEIDRRGADYTTLVHETEHELINFLSGYYDVVEKAAAEYAPNYISNYIYELSKKFNRMYENCSVLKAETPEKQRARADLVEAAGAVIAHGLGLLGIVPVERM